MAITSDTRRPKAGKVKVVPAPCPECGATRVKSREGSSNPVLYAPHYSHCSIGDRVARLKLRNIGRIREDNA